MIKSMGQIFGKRKSEEPFQVLLVFPAKGEIYTIFWLIQTVYFDCSLLK